MGAITRDPREYRRGMILGLTLAETLLLLLFLLLLASTVVLWRREEALQQARDAIEELRPLLEEVRRRGGGPDQASVDELAARLERGEAAVAERDRLRATLVLAEQRARDAEHAKTELAARLQRSAAAGRPDIAARLAQAEQRAEQAERGQQWAAEVQAAAERDAASAREQLGRSEADRDRSIAEGMIAGGVYPSCWRLDGAPEFVFQVNLLTGGRVVVTDRASPTRRSEEAWRLLEPFPRGAPMDVATFVGATRRMADWAQRQSPACRFWISVRREMPADAPTSEYLRVIGPLGNAATRHIPFYRIGG